MEPIIPRAYLIRPVIVQKPPGNQIDIQRHQPVVHVFVPVKIAQHLFDNLIIGFIQIDEGHIPAIEQQNMILAVATQSYTSVNIYFAGILIQKIGRVIKSLVCRIPRNTILKIIICNTVIKQIGNTNQIPSIWVLRSVVKFT